MHSRDFTGITEMRPGVYCFNDLDQEYIGACSANDLALSVLASVIGPHLRLSNRALSNIFPGFAPPHSDLDRIIG